MKMASIVAGLTLVVLCIPSAVFAVQMGDKGTFYYRQFDHLPPYTPTDQVPLTATCVAVTEHAYWFVDDAANNVNDFDVDDLMEWLTLFEVSTPGDATKGAMALLGDTYGYPRTVDDDDRVYLVFHDFTAMPGRCQTYAYWRQEDIQAGENANPHDVFYLHAGNLDGQDVCGSVTDITRNVAMPAVLKEYVHFLVAGHDLNESPWVREGLALMGLYQAGYYTQWSNDVQVFATTASARFKETDRGLSYTYNNGALFLFFTYLQEQKGKAALTSMVTGPAADFNAVAQAVGEADGLTFYRRWTAANWINEGRTYGYQDISVPSLVATKIVRDLDRQDLYGVRSWSTDYIKVVTQSLDIKDRLRISLDTQEPRQIVADYIQMQEPRSLSLVRAFDEVLNSDGSITYRADLEELGPSSPEVMVIITRTAEDNLPLTVALTTELNIPLPVDGDEDEELEPELEPEPEPEPEDEAEPEQPEWEEYVLDRRERNPGGSSSGCNGMEPSALVTILLAMGAVRRWRKNA